MCGENDGERQRKKMASFMASIFHSLTGNSKAWTRIGIFWSVLSTVQTLKRKNLSLVLEALPPTRSNSARSLPLRKNDVAPGCFVIWTEPSRRNKWKYLQIKEYINNIKALEKNMYFLVSLNVSCVISFLFLFFCCVYFLFVFFIVYLCIYLYFFFLLSMYYIGFYLFSHRVFCCTYYLFFKLL